MSQPEGRQLGTHVQLTPEQQVVDRVRIYLGMRPLYATTHEPRSAHGGYLWKEVLCRLAKPDCTRCGGSGYFDGWDLDERCPCTGLPPKGKRGTGRHNIDDRQRALFQPRRREGHVGLTAQRHAVAEE